MTDTAPEGRLWKVRFHYKDKSVLDLFDCDRMQRFNLPKDGWIRIEAGEEVHLLNMDTIYHMEWLQHGTDFAD